LGQKKPPKKQSALHLAEIAPVKKKKACKMGKTKRRRGSRKGHRAFGLKKGEKGAGRSRNDGSQEGRSSDHLRTADSGWRKGEGKVYEKLIFAQTMRGGEDQRSC